jgi:hypothetical protein
MALLVTEDARYSHWLGFDFTEGVPLRLQPIHLQVVEAFCDQLLTAINMSLVLVELAQPEIRELVLATSRLKK